MFHCLLSMLVCLLPLFQEDAATDDVMRYSLDVIKNVIDYTNLGQTPIVVDQHLFAIAKTQWKWPWNYGEDKFVIVFT